MTTKTRAYKLLLIGCGDIGSRHLQAAAALKELGSIEVLDARPESLTLGKERLAEVAVANADLETAWLTRFEDAGRDGDLCIIGTQAEGRLDLLRKAAALGYKRFLLEKIVAQSVSEYDQMLALAKEAGLSIWVNCKTRAYPFHQAALNRFDPAAPIEFTVIGGQHGLGTNGLHSTDLFVFYDRCKTIRLADSAVDSALIPSKRSSKLFELSGTLVGVSEKGSRFTLSLTRGHSAPPTYLVSSPNYRFFLDQWSRTALVSEASDGWRWKPAPFEGNLDISVMSQTFIRQIIEENRCDLPTLEACYPAHVFILTALQPHFEQLLGRSLSYCPIT